MVYARADVDLDQWWPWRWKGIDGVKYISETTGEKINAVGRVFYEKEQRKGS